MIFHTPVLKEYVPFLPVEISVRLQCLCNGNQYLVDVTCLASDVKKIIGADYFISVSTGRVVVRDNAGEVVAIIQPQSL